MKFKSVLSRLTGISTPVFGVSWQPQEAAVDAATRVLTFLEDRRVLYVPSEVEVPAHCVASVLKIRSFLTVEIGRASLGDPLEESLRAMRASCRRFLKVAYAADGRWLGRSCLPPRSFSPVGVRFSSRSAPRGVRHPHRPNRGGLWTGR